MSGTGYQPDSQRRGTSTRRAPARSAGQNAARIVPPYPPGIVYPPSGTGAPQANAGGQPVNTGVPQTNARVPNGAQAWQASSAQGRSGAGNGYAGGAGAQQARYRQTGYPAGGNSNMGGRNSAPSPQKPRPKSRLKRFLVLAMVFLLVGAGIAAGSVYLRARMAVEPYTALFVPGVYVDDIDLGGMTAEAGIQAVREKAAQKSDAWQVRLMSGGQQLALITSDMVGITFHTDDVLNQAWQYGHTGTEFDRQEEMALVAQSPVRLYSVQPDTNNAIIDETLTNLRASIYTAPRDAALLAFDPSLLDPFSFQPEVVGYDLDTAPVRERIYEMVSRLEAGDVEITPTATYPAVTVATLREKLQLRARATTPIAKASTDNRNENIEIAFSKINGKILKPGEKFSFNGIVGARTERNGFKEAIEYAYGELSMGFGGGVCQASTTIYVAAIESGLQIIDRSPHSDPVSYTDLAKDATVYYSSNRKIDLSFKNNTQSNLYITAKLGVDPYNKTRKVCEVRIFGESLGEGVQYKLVSVTTQILVAPTEPEYVKDKSRKYVTYVDEEQTVIKARDGAVAESYLVKYVNGVEVERTLVSEDTYKARAARIYVGTKAR